MSGRVVLQPITLPMPIEEYERIRSLFRPGPFMNTLMGAVIIGGITLGTILFSFSFIHAIKHFPDVNYWHWIVSGGLTFLFFGLGIARFVKNKKEFQQLPEKMRIIFALQTESMRYNEVIASNDLFLSPACGDEGLVVDRTREALISAWGKLLLSAIYDCHNDCLKLAKRKLSVSQSLVFNFVK